MIVCFLWFWFLSSVDLFLIQFSLQLADNFFRRLFSCQSFIENFLKAGHLTSGQNFLHQMTIPACFSFQMFSVNLFKSFRRFTFWKNNWKSSKSIMKTIVDQKLFNEEVFFNFVRIWTSLHFFFKQAANIYSIESNCFALFIVSVNALVPIVSPLTTTLIWIFLLPYRN